MTQNQIEEKIKIIRDGLKICPLCGRKADIIGMHTTFNEVIVDSVGCFKCNLRCERKTHVLVDLSKPFSRPKKHMIDPVLTWNHRSLN